MLTTKGGGDKNDGFFSVSYLQNALWAMHAGEAKHG